MAVGDWLFAAVDDQDSVRHEAQGWDARAVREYHAAFPIVPADVWCEGSTTHEAFRPVDYSFE